MGDVSKIERRMYQELIIRQILRSKREKKNLIVELDAGMGKRIISYLLTKALPPNERILIITPSQTSLRDTINTFRELGINEREIGYITSGVHKYLRDKHLRERRIIIATPISLANALRRKSEALKNFSVIIINEIDKVVRRVAETEEVPQEDVLATAKEISKKKRSTVRRVRLVYPWTELKNYFPKDACIVGMSGTLRDKHVLRERDGEISFVPEMDTLINSLFPRDRGLTILTMDALIQRTDIGRYLIRNYTIVRKIGVQDSKIQSIDSIITGKIKDISSAIMEKYRDMFREKNIEKLERGLVLIPDSDFHKMRYLRLALVRRFLFASIPEHYSRFLKKPSIKTLIEKSLGMPIDEAIPKESSKIRKIIEITESWLLSKRKVTILCSFIRVSKKLFNELKNRGHKTFLITGKTINKGEILERFKKIDEPAVLIMTPVGERDIDLSQIDLILVHDIISTVKTMYQRIKRGRRCLVGILYYKDTFEERKLNKLLDRMRKLYPWSLKIKD